jgi:hypothetical protein
VRVRPLLLVVILGACGDDVVGGPDAAGVADAGPDAAIDAAVDAAIDAAPSYPKPCADLYDPDLVPEFNIEIDEAEWAAMADDCAAGAKQYRPILFHYGVESVPAMIRLKGNWSWICEKYQFVVSFNEVDTAGRFHGLRKIVLDAPWYDPTLLRERVAMDMLGRHGVPASCANSARVSVNGAYYGAYTNIERLDHEYLERNFADHDGNLYEGGVEKKTNEDDPDTSDADAFWAAADIDALAAVVDLQHAVTVWAGEAMLPDPDSYWAGVEINFYLYHHPTRGLLFLPYDADISFAENIWPEAASADPITYEHPGWLREAQYRIALSDPAWCAAFVAALEDARVAYDVPLMQARVEAWSAQIADAVADDTHRTFTLDEHDSAVVALGAFFATRAAFVDAWLADGGHCPVVWPN